MNAYTLRRNGYLSIGATEVVLEQGQTPVVRNLQLS